MVVSEVDRVRVSIPVVTVQILAPPSFTRNEAAAQPLSPLEVQCIAHNETTDEWPDGRLYDWLARGWEVTHSVRRTPHTFFYLRRPRNDIPTQAG